MGIFQKLRGKSLADILTSVKYKVDQRKKLQEGIDFYKKIDQFSSDDWKDQLGVDNHEILFETISKYESDSGYVFFPRNVAGLSNKTAVHCDLEFLVNMIYAHKFDVLGSGFKEMNLSASPGITKEQVDRRREGMMEEIFSINNNSVLFDNISSYSPINWHLDTKTLKKWPDDKWFIDINPGDIESSDIKMPWEVSRFYHAGPLGLFAYLNNDNDAANELKFQIIDWIAANRVFHGVNWRNAMEAGIRATNWLLGVSFLWQKNFVDSEFLWLFHKSMYEHANFIFINLEKNSFGSNNHYLGDLMGLISIGAALPWMPESDEWLIFATKEIVKEMDTQVNSDCSHFEASTSYHRFVTEIFAICHSIITSLPDSRKKQLLENSKTFIFDKVSVVNNHSNTSHSESTALLPERFSEKLYGMIELLKLISKPNGNIPQIGDNDSGRVIWLPLPFDVTNDDSVNSLLGSTESLIDYRNKNLRKHETTRFGWNKKQYMENISIWFPDFGLGVIKNLRLFIVISCGGNGGYGFGGHAHNDKLSFEMSLDGHDVIVDSGTYVYTSFPEMRNMFRSTMSHNTVVFPGLEQNVISDEDLFKLPDKSKAKMDKFGVDFFVGEHIGYGFNCKRTFNISENRLQVKDFTEKPGGYCVLNLHPDVSWKDGKLSRSNAIVRLDYSDFSDISVESAQYSPRYGVKVDTQRLVMKRTGKYSTFYLSWN